MRVWHLNLTWPSPPLDGITSAMQRLADAQRDAGATVTLFCPVLDGRSAVATAAAVRAGLRSAAQRPELVHFHSMFRPFHTFLSPVLGRLGIPYAVSPHSAAAPAGLARRGGLKRVYAGAVERRFLGAAALVCCLTDVEAADIARFAPGRRGASVVIPNPAPPRARAWDAAMADRGGRPRVVTLARFDVRQKGLDRLDALARMCPEADFDVYGEPDKNDPERVERLRVAAPRNLRFRPAVFGPARDEVLSRAALFILPSRWEGLSMSLVEALAAGVPCAVSREVAATLPVADEGLGLVLAADAATAADQVRAAVGDPGLLRSWSAAGAAYAASHFDAVAVANRTLEGYAAACGTRHVASAAPAGVGGRAS